MSLEFKEFFIQELLETKCPVCQRTCRYQNMRRDGDIPAMGSEDKRRLILEYTFDCGSRIVWDKRWSLVVQCPHATEKYLELKDRLKPDDLKPESSMTRFGKIET